MMSFYVFFDPTAGSITTTSDVEDIKTVDSEYDQLPPIVDDKLVLLEPSKSFYTRVLIGLKNLAYLSMNGI
jgi:hypothetical protein